MKDYFGLRERDTNILHKELSALSTKISFGLEIIEHGRYDVQIAA